MKKQFIVMSADDYQSVPTPPSIWNQLSGDDQAEFLRIRRTFQDAPKVTSRDRRVQTFPRDLKQVVSFIERSPQDAEVRAIVVGLCFVHGIFCINTRQLKTFMARCKSSINGSFQALGYTLVATKSKARECCRAAMPTLRGHREVIRQWTARVVREPASHDFVSSFTVSGLPEIKPEDLYQGQKMKREQTKPKTVDITFDTEVYSPMADFEFPPAFEIACPVETVAQDDDWPIELERDVVMQSPTGLFDDVVSNP
jgi:hypothetical protein